MIDVLRSFFGPVLRDRRGAAAILWVVALIPVFGAGGMAVNSSLAYLLKSRMSKSLDTAGLAAGRVALDGNAEAVARQYFDANFGDTNPSVVVDDFDLELDEAREFVTLTARATAPTVFMRVFGRDTMSVAARTVIQRETTGMELALVMDNTGSMWGSPFTAMKTAAFDLIDIIYGDETEIENLWISLVPYVATVNIGPARTPWLAPGDRVLTNLASYSTAGWKGCVMAQAAPRDGNDDPPAVQKFTSYFYPATTRTEDNKWPPMVTSIADLNQGTTANRNTARSPNLGCGSPITPLTGSRATIDAALAAMGPIHRGGTTGNLGLSWGWRTISPRWRGLWGGATPNTHPLDYHTPLIDKVVVFLTDGNNQFHDQDTGSGTPKSDFTGYGRLEALGVATLAAGRAILDDRMEETCEDMKAEGIRIYTIVFGSAPDATARTLFTNCASSPSMYYYAPSNNALATAFRAIGGQLANLRIVE